MEISDELLEMFSEVPFENGRYIINDDMPEDLKVICQKANAFKEKQEKIREERRKAKRSMGL